MAPRTSVAAGSLLVMALLLAPPATGSEARPPSSASDVLRRHVESILALTQTPAFRELGLEERRAAIRGVTDELIDWTELARRALGDRWEARTEAERRRFADWFAGLAERAFTAPVDRLSSRRVPPELLRYRGESERGEETIVHMVVGYPRELPVDVVMHRRADGWKVADFEVWGVSAADNYRAQFDRVIGMASFPHLVERMRAMLPDAP